MAVPTRVRGRYLRVGVIRAGIAGVAEVGAIRVPPRRQQDRGCRTVDGDILRHPLHLLAGPPLADEGASRGLSHRDRGPIDAVEHLLPVVVNIRYLSLVRRHVVPGHRADHYLGNLVKAVLMQQIIFKGVVWKGMKGKGVLACLN